MVAHTWNKAGGGDWSTTTNWTPTGTPGLVASNGDDVRS